MNVTFIKAFGIMRVTRDPLLVKGAQTPLVNLSLVANYSFRQEDGSNVDEDPTYLEAQVRGKKALHILKYVRRGTVMQVEGRLKLDQWADGTGAARAKMKLMLEDYRFISDWGAQATAPQGTDNTKDVDEDVPF